MSRRLLPSQAVTTVKQKSGKEWHECAFVDGAWILHGGRSFAVFGNNRTGITIVRAEAALPHSQLHREGLALRGAITDGMTNATAYNLCASKSSPGNGSTYTIKTTWGSKGAAPCGSFSMSNGIILNVRRPTEADDAPDAPYAPDAADAAIEAASQMHAVDEDFDHAFMSATVAAASDVLVSVPIEDLLRLRESADTLVKCIDALLK
jgi:hypothetical protein